MPKKILLVDDSPTPLAILKKEFERQGCEVTTAASGAEALEKIAVDKPDLVITDTVMPGMDGFELCRQVKHSSTAQALKVIIMTGTMEAISAKKARESGADDYCVKTSDLGLVVSAAQNFL